ncbi:MAG: tetratricopeptide repeat protein [Planctomycetota bacterium]|jgi:tetratricopeptide (TPR) repeat protein
MPGFKRSFRKLPRSRNCSGELEVAEEYDKRALEMRRTWYKDGATVIGSSLHNLGKLYVRMDRRDEAEEVLNEALQIFEPGSNRAIG